MHVIESSSADGEALCLPGVEEVTIRIVSVPGGDGRSASVSLCRRAGTC